MPTLDQIKKQIELLPTSSTFGTKKEINSLPEIMKEDEIIRGLTSGLTGGNTWLIVCTNKRILLLDKGMIFGLKKNEIPLDKVNSIESERGIIFGQIIIWHGSSKIVITEVSKKTVEPFVQAVQESIENIKNKISNQSNSLSIADELEKLLQLKNKGSISEDEFIVLKKNLLSK